jgi:hypothetical protein
LISEYRGVRPTQGVTLYGPMRVDMDLEAPIPIHDWPHDSPRPFTVEDAKKKGNGAAVAPVQSLQSYSQSTLELPAAEDVFHPRLPMTRHQRITTCCIVAVFPASYT